MAITEYDEWQLTELKRLAVVDFTFFLNYSWWVPETAPATPTKGTNMADNVNYSNVLFVVDEENIRAVRVSYEDNGTQRANNLIKKTYDKTIKPGDFVIVETNTRWQMTVCKVTAVDVEVDFESDEQIGWVIAKVDLAEFDKVKEMEATAINMIKEAKKRDKRRELQESLRRSAGEDLKALPIYNLKPEEVVSGEATTINPFAGPTPKMPG